MWDSPWGPPEALLNTLIHHLNSDDQPPHTPSPVFSCNLDPFTKSPAVGTEPLRSKQDFFFVTRWEKKIATWNRNLQSSISNPSVKNMNSLSPFRIRSILTRRIIVRTKSKYTRRPSPRFLLGPPEIHPLLVPSGKRPLPFPRCSDCPLYLYL